MWTPEDLNNLKAAIASGALSVRYEGPPGRTVTYQNLTEMRKLLASMVADINRQAGKSRVRLSTHRKGF